MTLYSAATFFANTQQRNIGPYTEQHCCWQLLRTVEANNVAPCMGAFKKSVITQHVNSAKHATGLKCIASKEKREKSIADLLKKYDDEAHPSGENLAESTRIYRVKVVTAFLKAGVPLNKVDYFRELLEKSSYRLTASQNLSEMIPFIRNVEREKLQKEIEGKKLSVIFDGTTHVCEAMVIVLRN